MPVLTLEVIGGLCSRLRAVVGAIAYCEATGKDLVVNWSPSEPNFDHGFPARLCDLFANQFTERPVIEKRNKDPRVLGSKGDVFLRTCHLSPFMQYVTKPWSHYWNILRPSRAVAYLIDAVNVPGRYTGVHIRFTLKQSGSSAPGWQIDRMSQREPPFFLSCDSPDVSRLVRESHPVIEQQKDYEYDTVGIQKALADLYLLIRSDWLIGANYSSYSQLAALVRGAEYVGPHSKPGGLRGGMYEDAWNAP